MNTKNPLVKVLYGMYPGILTRDYAPHSKYGGLAAYLKFSTSRGVTDKLLDYRLKVSELKL